MKQNMPFMKLIFSLGLVSVVVICGAIYRLYLVKLEEQQHHLMSMLHDQVELLEYLYVNGGDEIKAELTYFISDENILIQNERPAEMITLDENLALVTHGKTGRTMGGKVIGDRIVYFTVGNDPATFIPDPLPLDSQDFSPMMAAVKGQSGSRIIPAVDGRGLIATYQHVPAMNIGIVSLVDVDEIRAPFVKYGIITLVIGIVAVGSGMLIYRRYGAPFVAKLAEDLTEQKTMTEKTEAQLAESEKKYQSIFDNSDDPMWLMKDGCFIQCNDAAVRVFECEEKSEFYDLHPSQFSPLLQPDGKNSYLQAEEQMKKALKDRYARFYWVHKRIASGEEFPAEVTLTRITLDGQTGLHAMVRDITEEKIIEENLQKALVDAERANEAKSEFLASMSHELRTPLNAILGFSEMLKAQYLGPLGTEKYFEYAGDIHESGAHLLDLINDILDISAIEARRNPMDRSKFDFEALAEDCIGNVTPQAEKAGIRLQSNINDVPEHICAHKRGIKQIIINLLANGVKYNHEGGTVTLNASVRDNMLYLSVADNGFGIEEKYLSRIMEPFSRVEEDSHMAQEGTGLGLSICQKLVEAYGGKIRIESTYGAGTTVLIDIPLDQEPTADRAA